VGKPVNETGQPVNNTAGKFSNNANRGKTDSLQKRNKNEDSITISYRFFQDVKRNSLDSSIIDYVRYPVQPQWISLGNNGAAAKPILFDPIFKAGFDEGKHSWDAYKWDIKNVKFYRTTRPYTELGYVLGSKAEQVIHLTYTQNIKRDWNMAFEYRLITAPGYLRSQKNNHNNLAITSYYQGKRKRYANWVILLNNSLKANDYGGIKDKRQLSDPNRDDRSLVETNLNNNIFSARNPFDSKLESGHWNREKLYQFIQSYDIGKKDSVPVNDSTVQYLFYPKLRFEHSITYSKEFFLYKGLLIDSAFYKLHYGTDTLFTKTPGGFELKDDWNKLVNDFSIYQFPDTKNTQQFIKAGISYENMKGNFYQNPFRSKSRQINNLFLHGEYKNRTRNQKWDIDANGAFYLSGYHAGDYEMQALLILKGKGKPGNLKLQFQHVNRTPSFIFYNQSSFNRGTVPGLKKENHTQLTAQLYNEKKQQNLCIQLLVANNTTTWQGYTSYRQESLFNMLKLSFERAFPVYRHLVWRTEAQFQQVIIGNPNINFPVLYTRNKIAYEGNFGRKNLRIATGLELRYLTPYHLDAFSSLNGQFIYQDSISSKRNLPDINLYLNFNITSFNAFVRIENLNTAKIRTGNAAGLKFVNNNYAALDYPNPGMLIKLGIYWRFIN
jgi:hypothetical protein